MPGPLKTRATAQACCTAWGAANSYQLSELTPSSFTAVGSAGASRFGWEEDEANGTASSVCRYSFELSEDTGFSISIHLTTQGNGSVSVSVTQVGGRYDLRRSVSRGYGFDFTYHVHLRPGVYQVDIDASSDTATAAFSNSSDATYELRITADDGGVPVEKQSFGRLKALFESGN